MDDKGLTNGNGGNGMAGIVLKIIKELGVPIAVALAFGWLYIQKDNAYVCLTQELKTVVTQNTVVMDRLVTKIDALARTR